MFIRLGTDKHHVTLEILYYYEKPKQLNLLAIITPLFVIVITAWRPGIYLKWNYPEWTFWPHVGGLWKGGKDIIKEVANGERDKRDS